MEDWEFLMRVCMGLNWVMMWFTGCSSEQGKKLSGFGDFIDYVSNYLIVLHEVCWFMED
jgi:hypothetical protein